MVGRKLASDWSEQSRELSNLLKGAGHGDRDAFAELYSRTSAHLFGVVLRICSNRSQAEDVLQEVYVNVWRSAQSFDAAQSQPMTWLTSVARNRAIDSLRRFQREPALRSTSVNEDEEQDVYFDLADDSPGPLERLSQAADTRALAECVKGLKPNHRQSLALAFFNGLSHSEVAAEMGQPLGTVKSWVRRALAALKDCLQANPGSQGHA